ncbi:MAG: hypothetical protein OEY33_05105 [Bdellovibrionales bacterium]|nr:hypothetical protein [Bdellovibrionales bacterium]
MIDEDYLQRKKEELNFLASLASYDEAFDIKSYQDVWDAKLFLKRKLKNKFFNSSLSVTNLSGRKKINLYGIPISYTYSRSNFKVEHNDFLKLIHPNLEIRNYISMGTFTANAQGTLSCLLSAIKIWDSKLGIKCLQKDIYYETDEFLEVFNLDNDSTILFLDSSACARNFSMVKYAKAIIIDTTCFSPNDEILEMWINDFINKNISIFLVRSHQKLDSFGMEYSSLGSITYIKRDDSMDEVYALFVKLLSHFGGLPSIENIYPFFNKKEFFALTEKRVEIIKSRNQIELEHSRNFDHGLYSWSQLSHRIEKETLAKAAIRFCEKMTQFGIPLKFVESFGWDFSSISILKFENYNRGDFFGNKLFKVRLAISDISVEDAYYLKKCYQHWLESFA